MLRVPRPAPGFAGRAASILRNAGTRDHRDAGTGTVLMQRGCSARQVGERPGNEFCREMSVVFKRAAAACTARVRERGGGPIIHCKSTVFCKVPAGWPGAGRSALGRLFAAAGSCGFAGRRFGAAFA